MLRTARIFLMFMQRDAYIYWHRKKTYLINYSLIYPALYAFFFAYLQTNLYFGAGNEKLGSMIFVGNILLTMMTLTYKLTIGLLFDLEKNRFIDYQTCILTPHLVLIQRIIFTSLFTFTLLLPFFPFAKLLLGEKLVTTNTNWLAMALILYTSTLFCSAYHMLISCALPNGTYLTQFWARLNQPLLTLGGFLVPLQVINTYSPTLGLLCRANPFIYVTEGLRQTIIGGQGFLPLATCIFFLFFFSVLCTLLALHAFKKRTDHV